MDVVDAPRKVTTGRPMSPSPKPTMNSLEYHWDEATTSWVYQQVPDDIRQGLVDAGLLGPKD